MFRKGVANVACVAFFSKQCEANRSRLYLSVRVRQCPSTGFRGDVSLQCNRLQNGL